MIKDSEYTANPVLPDFIHPHSSEVSADACDDFVTIPRAEYDDLKAARFALELIGNALSKYGVDDRIAEPVLKMFGYTRPVEADDA